MKMPTSSTKSSQQQGQLTDSTQMALSSDAGAASQLPLSDKAAGKAKATGMSSTDEAALDEDEDLEEEAQQDEDGDMEGDGDSDSMFSDDGEEGDEEDANAGEQEAEAAPEVAHGGDLEAVNSAAQS